MLVMAIPIQKRIDKIIVPRIVPFLLRCDQKGYYRLININSTRLRNIHSSIKYDKWYYL